MAELEPLLSRPLTPGGAECPLLPGHWLRCCRARSLPRFLLPLSQVPAVCPQAGPMMSPPPSRRLGPVCVSGRSLSSGRAFAEAVASAGNLPPREARPLRSPSRVLVGARCRGPARCFLIARPPALAPPRGPRVVPCQHPPGCPSYSSAWSPGRELHRGGGGRARSPLCP